MSIQVLGYDGTPFNFIQHASGNETAIRTMLKLLFSGNYPTGGDKLDLTNGGGTPAAPSTIPPAVQNGLIDIDILPRSTATSGQTASGGGYVVIAPNADAPLTFSDVQNLKLKIFNAGGGELSAGAYPAAVTGDVVVLECFWAR